MTEDKWLREYLQEMSKKLDVLTMQVNVHMAKDREEHLELRKDIDHLKMNILKWILIASVGAGGATAGAAKAIVAIFSP